MKVGLDKTSVGYLKALERLNQLEPMWKIQNSMEYAEEHPYWRDRAEQELAKRALDAQIRLLAIIWPEKFGEAAEKEEEGPERCA
jgi:hypothetical protein